MANYLRNLFLHQVPLWHLPLVFILLHSLIYLYFSWFRQSLLAMIAFALIPYFLYKLIRPTNCEKPQQCEMMSEESCKTLYVWTYVCLNKVTEYIRSII